MNRRWIFVGLFVLTLGAITAIAFWGPDRDWDRGDRRVEVVRVVDADGNAIEGESTVIIDGGRHGFPFGLLLIPLVLFLVFGLLRRAFWGPPGGGPWDRPPDDRGRDQWLAEWHARQHQRIDGGGTPPSPEGSGQA